QCQQLIAGEGDAEGLEGSLGAGAQDLPDAHDGGQRGHAGSCILPSMAFPVTGGLGNKVAGSVALLSDVEAPCGCVGGKTNQPPSLRKVGPGMRRLGDAGYLSARAASTTK